MPYSYEPHYFEDFEEGKEFESVGRTVTEADLTMHSAISGDWTELHSNAEYAEDTDFEQRIAHGPLTFVLSTGFVYRSGIVERTAVAFLGMNYMDLPNPVFIGDTLSQTMWVADRTDLESRDDAGLVTIEVQTTKEDGTVVLEGDMKFLIEKRT